MVIWKFDVLPDKFECEMPEGAAILTVQTQGSEPKMWALVDPTRPRKTRRFATFATGQPVPDGGDLRYVGTFQLDGGDLIFHLFEIGVETQ